MTIPRVLIVLEMTIAVLAIGGAVALLVAPTGQPLGLDVAMMQGVFNSFVVPALALFGMGVMFVIAAFMTMQEQRWSTVASPLVAATLLVWLAVQWMIVGFISWTQVAFFLIATAIFILSARQWRDGAGPHPPGESTRRVGATRRERRALALEVQRDVAREAVSARGTGGQAPRSG